MVDINVSPRVASQSIKQYALIGQFPDVDFATLSDDDFRIYKQNYQVNYTSSEFRPGSYRVAVYRDPIDRFVSACNHDYHNWNKYPQFDRKPFAFKTFDELFTHWLDDSFAKHKHYFTQTTFLGSRDQYDLIFNITQIDNLFLWLGHNNTKYPRKGELPWRHFDRDQLSVDQIGRLRIIYKDDYDNGWCQ